jgi:ribosomal protein S18 acetylase RimI-like enzyme
MQIALRPALPDDFEFCKRLYFVEMASIIDALNLNREAQAISFGRQWVLDQVRIVTRRSNDGPNSLAKDSVDRIGWLQTVQQEHALFLSQLFIDAPFQRQGIGTELMHRLIAEAANFHLPVELDVVKINPALRLYKRLGFRIIGEEPHKFNMRREPDNAGLHME